MEGDFYPLLFDPVEQLGDMAKTIPTIDTI